jgi:hypothetical protein
MAEYNQSLCAYYAMLIEGQLHSDDTDMAAVQEQLDNIKKHCTVTANPPGEVPEQLEGHLFEEGSTETGTVVVDGVEMPASAASRAEHVDADDV